MIKNETKMTPEIITKFQKDFGGRSQWFILGMCVLVVLCGVMQLIWEDVAFGIFCIVFGVIFFPITLIMQKLTTKKYIKSLALNNQIVNKYEFDDNEIRISSLNRDKLIGTSVQTYDQLFKVEERDDCYYLYISNRQSFIVVKEGFVEGTSADLSVIFATKIPNKYRVKLSKKKKEDNKNK